MARDLGVVRAGVKEAEHERRLFVPAALAVKMVNISYFRNIKVLRCGTGMIAFNNRLHQKT